MRLPATVLTAVLGAGVLWMAGGAPAADASLPAPVCAPALVAPAPALAAPADAALSAPARPGTCAEAVVYEQRQADSPEAQEFAGGHVVIIILAIGCFVFLFICGCCH
jgi:hypothetical protein